MSLFRKIKYGQVENRRLQDVPKDVASKCPKCRFVHIEKELVQRLRVCHKCGYHFTLSSQERLDLIIDEDSFKEINVSITSRDPLDFPQYREKLEKAKEKSNLAEAIITGVGKIEGIETAVGILAPEFMLGSMGSVVGEKITRLIETAENEEVPLVIFSASGGARMQESIFSLMQMAKTSGALARLGERSLPFISVLTHPTTGGVTASFAMLGDINIAEPGALIGFAGPRVIEQTIGEKLPEGFQSAEFLLEHGFLDKVVERKKLKKTIAQLLHLHGGGEKVG